MGGVGKEKEEAAKKRNEGAGGRRGGAESETEGKELKAGLLNVVLRFEVEKGVMKVYPMTQTKIVRGKAGELNCAKVLANGNLFEGSNRRTA